MRTRQLALLCQLSSAASPSKISSEMYLKRRLQNLRRIYSQLVGLGDELAALREEHEQLLRAMESLHDREPELRERLRQLRRSDDYERPFTEDEPLVSVTIPTWTNVDALVKVSLPSVLAQTYERMEVIVVGDAAPPEVERAVASFGDKRVRFYNLPYRGPYPSDPQRRWYVAGIPPANEAARLARGAWIAQQDDDDEFTPTHVERLVEAARSTRSEVAYGRFETADPRGQRFVTGVLPPTMGHFAWQAAIYHEGLRFFELELSDAWFGTPGDWSLCRRMLNAGVRMTMIDDVVARLYPSATALQG
jgi:glycosyl transferase family 2